MKETGPNLIEENFILDYFSVESEDLLKIDELNANKLTKKFLQGGPQKCPYFSLVITFTKIRKSSRFFLHRYWKFIEFFWCKPL